MSRAGARAGQDVPRQIRAPTLWINQWQKSVRSSPPPQDGHCFEVFLEKAHEQHGLPIVIHHIFQNMLIYSQRISAVPEAIMQCAGTLDLVNPKTVGRRIIEAVIRSEQDLHDGRVTDLHETETGTA
ncbi:hypothetical protein E4U41_005812 [Claviceps citrina]|nr:hypothetical protein E4U41_005812 [Claviceps citrina]